MPDWQLTSLLGPGMSRPMLLPIPGMSAQTLGHLAPTSQLGKTSQAWNPLLIQGLKQQLHLKLTAPDRGRLSRQRLANMATTLQAYVMPDRAGKQTHVDMAIAPQDSRQSFEAD